jgi:hypothetical protein
MNVSLVKVEDSRDPHLTKLPYWMQLIMLDLGLYLAKIRSSKFNTEIK